MFIFCYNAFDLSCVTSLSDQAYVVETRNNNCYIVKKEKILVKRFTCETFFKFKKFCNSLARDS